MELEIKNHQTHTNSTLHFQKETLREKKKERERNNVYVHFIAGLSLWYHRAQLELVLHTLSKECLIFIILVWCCCVLPKWGMQISTLGAGSLCVQGFACTSLWVLSRFLQKSQRIAESHIRKSYQGWRRRAKNKRWMNFHSSGKNLMGIPGPWPVGNPQRNLAAAWWWEKHWLINALLH